MAKAIVIPPRDPVYLADIEPNDGDLVRGILGGWMEHITTWRDGVMLANEDGVRLNLPPNLEAERLAHVGIAGTVILFGPAVGGELTDVPEHWVESFGLT